MDLNDLNVEELKSLKEAVADELSVRREKALEDERNAKKEREAKFKDSVGAGDVITFMFDKEETEAEVVRVSEKSVTIEMDGKKKYVKYSRIVGVVKAEVEPEADEAENKEAVA